MAKKNKRPKWQDPNATPLARALNAEEIVERFRYLLAMKYDSHKISALIEQNYGVKPLIPCNGEAHNPEVGGMIDHCMVCAPRWGWIDPHDQEEK